MTADLPTLVAKTLADIRALLPSFFLAVVMLIGFWVVGKGISLLIKRLANHRSHQQQALYTLIGRSVGVTITLLGIMCALGTLGINITALVTSLGLVGFAVGFALKDALSNVCAGFMLLMYQPFKLDTSLTIGAVTGKVIDINLRYTTLESEGERVMIPNSTVLTSTIRVEKCHRTQGDTP